MECKPAIARRRGIARFSKRSIAATLIFLMAGIATATLMEFMPEIAIHLTLLAVAVAGAIAGLVASYLDWVVSGNLIWSAATIPVAAALAISILRDLLIGCVGVDAIALVAMVSSIAALAAPFVALKPVHTA